MSSTCAVSNLHIKHTSLKLEMKTTESGNESKENNAIEFDV
jgi:hypothetical protein